MNHSLSPRPQAGDGRLAPGATDGQRRPLGLRTRAMLFGVLAAAILTGLIALGSRGFHWFDATLIGYAVASIFAVAAVTYKYSFWLARPQTGRYWRRSWQLFFSYANFRRYTVLIPTAILDLFSQQFIRRRGMYRWLTHQCIFWGVILSCCITFSLTFGWIRMTLTATGQHLVWFFGFPLLAFPVDSALGWLIYHALDLTAILLFIGLVLALHRRFHDLSLITVQRFGFDLMPLALLMAIVITGLALTADSTWLRGAYYWYISLTHEVVVVLWLISLPFGKFFHLIERPATVGIELYWKTGEGTEMQTCARCGEAFAPVRFIQDLKKTLLDVGENYSLREDVFAQQSAESTGTEAEEQATRTLWWQDLCPSCKRVARGQATLAALDPGGNRFL
ncbi:hypothetical protein [Dictyobacter aurantiacus]|uniref:Uncharacterized protein n=1 Tax=Dictyobacter aurantiacus TaxID=1936993 RepID=A0A401ZM66_9CHLR|nr:hypothetical protein [Dictyobacter aurantiacus]GCE07920.1 hypothetical protein KDAU_52490 [Dictyobacter aurantiacus]